MSVVAQISKRAKTIRAANPKMKWTDAIKQASKEIKGQKTTSKSRKTPKKRVAGNQYERFDFYKAYQKAPQKVKNILDTLPDKDYQDYYVLDTVAKALKKIGWELEFDLSGEITMLRPVKKTAGRVASPKLHKDNKSHNVTIKVGKQPGKKTVGKTAKVTRPKIERSTLPLDKLNGIIKMKRNDFYEIVAGGNKNSVFQLQSTTTAKDGAKAYNVKFWEYRNRKLSKPFLAVISDKWLATRAIRPRSSVKVSETIGFV